jgi:hypothetical protein
MCASVILHGISGAYNQDTHPCYRSGIDNMMNGARNTTCNASELGSKRSAHPEQHVLCCSQRVPFSALKSMQLSMSSCASIIFKGYCEPTLTVTVRSQYWPMVTLKATVLVRVT